MRILLDTHTFLWFITGDNRCTSYVRALISDPDNEVFLSIASLWEIAIKVSLGKLALAVPFEQLFPAQLVENEIDILSIDIDDLTLIAKLEFHHRDPFDRLMVSQALTKNMPLLSNDSALDSYGIHRLWG